MNTRAGVSMCTVDLFERDDVPVYMRSICGCVTIICRRG